MGSEMCIRDSLYETLVGHMQRTGEEFRLKKFERPTSVENLSWMLFTEITDMGFRLDRIEVRETDTSVVIYSREDWIADNRQFAQQPTSSVETE